MTETIIST